MFSQNFVLLIAFGSPSSASSSVFALYRECSEISFQRCPTRTLFIRIFRVLNTVQSFIFKVHIVAVLSSNAQYFITLFSLCQQLFSSFFKLKRRRRDLDPRAAINDLHPFQGCPFSLLGTSAKSRCLNISKYYIVIGKPFACPTERVGFEPTRPCGQTVFKTASL